MKHAFLILAHSNYPLVSRLLKKLDYANNNIYIHIDAKSSFSQEDRELLINSCKFSKVVFIPRNNINWGGYSMVRAELSLFEFAAQDKNDYYHLLSGVDFPTKPMDYIHDFFRKNSGCEFIHFCNDEFNKAQKKRYALYHFLQEKCGRNNKLFSIIERSLLFVQKLLKIDRTKRYGNIDLKCGSQWASITHELVVHLLSKEKQIEKMFSNTSCSDECFLQTIAYNSPFVQKLYTPWEDAPISENLRSIDWERSGAQPFSPYTYLGNDYEELVNSQNLFCRKVTDATPEGNALIEKLELL